MVTAAALGPTSSVGAAVGEVILVAARPRPTLNGAWQQNDICQTTELPPLLALSVQEYREALNR